MKAYRGGKYHSRIVRSDQAECAIQQYHVLASYDPSSSGLRLLLQMPKRARNTGVNAEHWLKLFNENIRLNSFEHKEELAQELGDADICPYRLTRLPKPVDDVLNVAQAIKNGNNVYQFYFKSLLEGLEESQRGDTAEALELYMLSFASKLWQTLFTTLFTLHVIYSSDRDRRLSPSTAIAAQQQSRASGARVSAGRWGMTGLNKEVHTYMKDLANEKLILINKEGDSCLAPWCEIKEVLSMYVCP